MCLIVVVSLAVLMWLRRVSVVRWLPDVTHGVVRSERQYSGVLATLPERGLRRIWSSVMLMIEGSRSWSVTSRVARLYLVMLRLKISELFEVL
jgi:hypothetical protein